MNNKFLTRRFLPIHVPVFVAMLLLPTVSQAAVNAYMMLSCNGSSIAGEPTMQSVGGVDVSDMIEVYAFGLNVSVAADADGRTTSRRSYKPVRILKRIDKASPLIVQALAQNLSCEAEIKFFRTDPDQGQLEHFYTVALSGARIAAIMPVLSSTLDPATAAAPITEAVSLAFNIIRFTHETSSSEFEDDWRQNI